MSDAIERQLIRAQQRVDTALGEQAQRLEEANAFVHGVIDVLLAKGVVSEEELAPAIARVRDELRTEAPGAAAVMLRSTPTATLPPVAVDCNARLSVCKAVCCKLDFALTVDELESGAVKWDLGRPYFVRHERDGYCTHAGRTDHRCTIYDQRPGVCRTYSCANDPRIWKDFDAMVVNEEWLDAHLGSRHQDMVVTRVLMHDPADLRKAAP